MEILLGSRNHGKILEFETLLRDSPIKIVSLNNFPELSDVDETGCTFEENAALKAQMYALQTGLHTLADDSGLVVDAIDGEPGIFSARYAGENSSNGEKIEKVLQKLAEKGNADRSAHFYCAMAFANGSGKLIRIETGVCNGHISTQPLGTKGFGYDPIFIPDGFDQTFGVLPEDIKDQISHRALAARKIIQFLRDFTVGSLDQSSFRL